MAFISVSSFLKDPQNLGPNTIADMNDVSTLFYYSS
jgi:hypothetical protein